MPKQTQRWMLTEPMLPKSWSFFLSLRLEQPFRWRRFHLAVEDYTKRVLDFGAWQTAYNVQLAYLLVPKRILLAADYGQYLAGAYDNPPASKEDIDVKPLNESQFRAAIHYYFWKNIGLVSLRYQDHAKQEDDESYLAGTSSTTPAEMVHEREVRLELGYRF